MDAGNDATGTLDMQVGTVYEAKKRVQQMLRKEIEKLESSHG